MTGQVDSKFGFGLASGDAARAVERVGSSPAFDLVGLHAHIGSQIFLLHSFEKAVEVLAGFVAPLGLPELCLGGGLGVRTSRARTLRPSASGPRCSTTPAGPPASPPVSRPSRAGRSSPPPG